MPQRPGSAHATASARLRQGTITGTDETAGTRYLQLQIPASCSWRSAARSSLRKATPMPHCAGGYGVTAADVVGLRDQAPAAVPG
jgi:hypothetical protein